MRVGVIGATGLVGRQLVERLHARGHQVAPVARSLGVDVTTGAGLDEALAGAEAVIDVTSTPETDPDRVRAFFDAETRAVLAAGQRAGVGHHVLLSIVGVDRVSGNAHYVGKRRQEELVRGGPVPATVLRATQFHNFAAMVVGWTRRGDTAVVPPVLVQPVAVSDVADTLADIATTGPTEPVVELAGPELQDLVDMARRTLAARGETVTLVPSWRDGPFGVDMAGEVLLPGPDALIGVVTFDEWLAVGAR